MQQIELMVSTIAKGTTADAGLLARCVHACFACAATSHVCADACLGEANVEALRRCIRLNLDSADQCLATGRIALRAVDPGASVLEAALELCARICAACEAECQMHAATHEHCRVAAGACNACERACRDLIQAMRGHVVAE